MPFSRDQEDTAGLFKRLTFAGVNIVTLAEGDITHLCTRVVKALHAGSVTTGEREIHPEQAAVVGRIFPDFVAGVSPEAIVKTLNREGVAGQFGGSWSPSTVHGNAKRGKQCRLAAGAYT